MSHYGFTTIYTDEALPGNKPSMMYDRNGDIVLIVHRPALLDDPEGTLASITRHCDANTKGHEAQLSVAV